MAGNFGLIVQLIDELPYPLSNQPRRSTSEQFEKILFTLPSNHLQNTSSSTQISLFLASQSPQFKQNKLVCFQFLTFHTWQTSGTFEHYDHLADEQAVFHFWQQLLLAYLDGKKGDENIL